MKRIEHIIEISQDWKYKIFRKGSKEEHILTDLKLIMCIRGEYE